MNPSIYGVIMAGGPGKRFWPMSTAATPKPFLRLTGKDSLLQECYRRLRHFLPAQRILVIGAEAHLGLIAEHLPELPPENCIGEAQARDSAACMGFGTELVAHRDPDGILLAVPADQVIQPVEKFAETMQALAHAASSENCLATLGIPPSEPAVRFGYLEVGQGIGLYNGHEVSQVLAFKEKPELAIAESYLESGRYLWNGGIFVAPVKVLQEAIQTHYPPLGEMLPQFRERLSAGMNPTAITAELYNRIPRISIDFAVIEKLEKVVTIRADFDWDDLGDWRALRRYLPVDQQNNAVSGRHIGVDTQNTIVVAEGLKVATLGLDNVVVVQSGESILVARTDRLDDLKQLVSAIEKAEKDGTGEA